MSDSYNVEMVHGDKQCGGATKCSFCAIRFAKIFQSSVGITLAKDLKPGDTLVIGFKRRLSDHEWYEATRRLGELLSCKVVLVPECEALAVLNGEDGEDVDH